MARLATRNVDETDMGITASSNIDFYQPSLDPTIFHPAVEIL
jgi:hypothetical protein